jgi:hypothetical protein
MHLHAIFLRKRKKRFCVFGAIKQPQALILLDETALNKQAKKLQNRF